MSLILTRKPLETIVIDDDIHITVLAIKGNQVKLGIDAPRDVTVNRLEIHERIQAEREDMPGFEGTRGALGNL